MNQRTPPTSTAHSYERSAKPLSLALKPSRSWRIFLIAVHTLAVIAALITTLPIIVKILIALLVAASFAYHIKQHNNPSHLVWRNGNRWFINQQQLPAELISIDFFSRWLVIITLQQSTQLDNESLLTKQKHKQKFIIPHDALTPNTFRLLRVRLKIEGFETLNPPPDNIK